MEIPKASVDQLVDDLATAFDQAHQGRNPSRGDLERLVLGLLDNAAARVTITSSARRPSRPQAKPSGGPGGHAEGT